MYSLNIKPCKQMGGGVSRTSVMIAQYTERLLTTISLFRYMGHSTISRPYWWLYNDVYMSALVVGFCVGLFVMVWLWGCDIVIVCVMVCGCVCVCGLCVSVIMIIIIIIIIIYLFIYLFLFYFLRGHRWWLALNNTISNSARQWRHTLR